ncbi:hypothetical protein [Riemerella anatipestifer]|uniref:Uncharacterized protein n=1 Tax=Riemerella anatipestifer RA-CH-1 TaxID=1228997 RepID=J9QTG8_RIEAN|nr:hypothetical protein [Riemerella anatipestifer]AFR35896.1 hypothetical protein B739_1298 [Riemerella anatipestifer RA-CH-1]MCU7581593.1 hypothetical protein [Riemerella anatipestifer]MDD1550130.1 hypothetical protein [Riemerella anatipestifer]MSN87430.1 hypothetical protein [Riemerella anatipestifer]MSN91592.1 hypothetical protein [Riemerella anatipestifer]
MYYRNTTDIELASKEIIEAGSLFKRENNIMVLVDDDLSAVVYYRENRFVKEENPNIITQYEVSTKYFNSILTLKEKLQSVQGLGSWSMSYNEVEYIYAFKSVLSEKELKSILLEVPYIDTESLKIS